MRFSGMVHAASVALVTCALAACASDSAQDAAQGASGVGAPQNVAGASGVTGQGNGGSSGSGDMLVATGRASMGTSPMPCNVADIIQRRCQTCHAATPVAGVPMALVSWEDLTAPAPSRADLTVAQYAALRVHGMPSVMPPPPGKLLDEELATLDAWFASGAPVGTDPTCAPLNDADGGTLPPKGPPPDTTCYEFKAHGASTAGDSSPYMVSNQHYACFYFDAPWPDGAQGVYFAPIFDAHAELVHHFVFYLDQAGNQPNGFVETCTGLHPSGPTMVAGWAPGSDNNELPPDVGMDLSPPNKKLLLEIHFFHDGSAGAIPTTSGLQVCTSNKKLTNTATVSLLGTEAIAIPAHAKGSATGTCTPQFQGEIHVLRSWPHMHEIGTSMQTVVNFLDGSSQTLGPWPFDFNSQVSYATPLVLKPGDRLTTTCQYDNTTDLQVNVGTDTKSEMCFNFVTAYPAGALKSKNILGGSTSATSSATACLQ